MIMGTRLADVVAAATADERAPAAALAMVYAEQIDECGHVTAAMATALDTLQRAAELADAEADKPAAVAAYRKVAAAVSAVTVAAELGPKLLAALDALLLTPKALAAVGQAIPPVASPANPLAAMRAAEDDLARQRAKHSA